MSFGHTLWELCGDEALRRREFPVVAHKTYLAHAAVCPLPAHVTHALQAYLAAISCSGQFEHLHAHAESEARRLAAEMIGASSDEIAFAASTSAGLGLIASGLPWQPGDSVVIAQGDFPSNVYPWLRLQKLGVHVRQIAARTRALNAEDVLASCDARTRLVALSSVHYATGTRLDLDAIGRALHAREILFCVDAIQSLGALPTSVQHVDFLVADAHKWLLGPQGIAVCYVRRAHFARLEPVLVGWKSVKASRDFSQQQLDFADTARRYEPGSLNALGLVGLHAALELLQTLGVSNIAARIAQLRAPLVHELSRKGYEVLGDTTPGTRSGIVSFRHPERDMQALQRALDAQQIIVSLRQDPQGRDCVRVAPHFYNTEAELERLTARL